MYVLQVKKLCCRLLSKSFSNHFYYTHYLEGSDRVWKACFCQWFIRHCSGGVIPCLTGYICFFTRKLKYCTPLLRGRGLGFAGVLFSWAVRMDLHGVVISLNEQTRVTALRQAELQSILCACIQVWNVTIAAIEKIIKMKRASPIRSN